VKDVQEGMSGELLISALMTIRPIYKQSCYLLGEAMILRLVLYHLFGKVDLAMLVEPLLMGFDVFPV